MKLFNTIAAATVIGTSFVSPNPAEAFWWNNQLGYDKINSGLSASEFDKARKAAIKNDDWIYSWTNKVLRDEFGNPLNLRFYISKIECKGSRCFYFSTNDKDDYEDVRIMQVDCTAKRTRYIYPKLKKDDWLDWGSWRVIPSRPNGWRSDAERICN